MHDRRCLETAVCSRGCRFGTHRLLLFLAGRAFCNADRRSLPHLRCGIGHAHHLVGDAIRLVFERIVDLSNNELRLKDA